MIEDLFAGDYRDVTAEHLPELVDAVIAHDWEASHREQVSIESTPDGSAVSFLPGYLVWLCVADALVHFLDENTTGPRSVYGRAREAIRRAHYPGDREWVVLGGLELYVRLCEAEGVAPYIDTDVHPGEYWP